MSLTPLLVARSQLLTPIDLFFADYDPVSVQALAGNAREILETLCVQSGVGPIKELILRDHPQKQHRDYYAAANLYRNCFKHVGRDESELRENQLILDQFDEPRTPSEWWLAWLARCSPSPTDMPVSKGKLDRGVKMKPTLFLFAFLISDAALAQEAASCKLLSEDKYARVWQCPPTSSPSNVSSPSSIHFHAI